MSFVLDAYAARSCPVKTFNAFDPTTQQPETPHDESLTEQFQGGRDFRAAVIDAVLSGTTAVTDLRQLDGEKAPWQEREAACLLAMEQGAPAIIGGVLPLDLEGHRSGRADILVRGDDTPEGRPGYWPVRIKPYRVTERQTKGDELRTSSLSAITKSEAAPDVRFRLFREAALLELAHAWRLLEATGYAAGKPWGGIVGQDPKLDDVADQSVTWINLAHKFIRTFSRTSPTGHKLRSALERYDHEHSFRVYVANQALARKDDPTTPPPVRPIRVRECEWCAWWEVCRPRMDDDDISLRLSKTPLDVRELQTLMKLGVKTVSELAEVDVDLILTEYLANTRHRDRAEDRLRQAARRARMLAQGVALERVTTDPIDVPRSDVEIDLDIETSEGDVTYLWGALVTDRRTGEQNYHHFSRFATITPEQEFELAAEFSSWLLSEIEKTPDLKVFHYSDYETVHLRRLAARSENPTLAAVCDLIPSNFVDLFTYVRQNFVAVDGLGLKTVATKGAGFAWRDEEPGGLASQSWFHSAVEDPDPDVRSAAKRRVLEYNEDDVRATWVVRNWLETVKPPSQ